MKTLRQEKEILRKAREAFAKPSPPGKRSGVGEHLQAYRRAEGLLPGGDAMRRMLLESPRRAVTLRLAQQAALGEEGAGRPSHPEEDPPDPQQEPPNLRLHESARRASLAWDRLRLEASSTVDEKAAGLRGCIRGK